LIGIKIQRCDIKAMW